MIKIIKCSKGHLREFQTVYMYLCYGNGLFVIIETAHYFRGNRFDRRGCLQLTAQVHF